MKAFNQLTYFNYLPEAKKTNNSKNPKKKAAITSKTKKPYLPGLKR
jgi:hypothetical protein